MSTSGKLIPGMNGYGETLSAREGEGKRAGHGRNVC